MASYFYQEMSIAYSTPSLEQLQSESRETGRGIDFCDLKPKIPHVTIIAIPLSAGLYKKEFKLSLENYPAQSG